MNKVLLLSSFISVAFAQRPTYAGSRPIGRPDLASRFRGSEETSSVAVDNRLGSDGTTAKIPTDARGDADLVNRLNQWPRENQPFWLLNAEHIEKHRHPDEASLNNQNVQNRNSVGGNSRSQFTNGDRINFQSRSNFDDYDTIPSRPIRPAQPRSSFLGR